MSDAKSDYLERKVLDHVLGTTAFTMPAGVYIALFEDDPTDADAGTEVDGTGNGYARQPVTFNAAATNTGVSTATNDGDIEWTNMPTVTVTHFALFDDDTAGNMLYHGELDDPKALTTGDNLTIIDQALVITEQ